MPQITVLPQWKADYALLTKAQKPPGITITTALAATAVPNKAPYVAMPTSAPFYASGPPPAKVVTEPPSEDIPEPPAGKTNRRLRNS